MSDKLLIDRKLLERLQERLDPHIDAQDWGMVCDAFRAQAKAATEAEPVEVVQVPFELLNRYVSDVEAHNYGFDGDTEIRLILDAARLDSSPVSGSDNSEQAAFEAWLVRVCPSGDADSVHAQWLESSDYEDFCDQTYDAEAERLTAEVLGTGAGINPGATSVDDIFLDASAGGVDERAAFEAWYETTYGNSLEPEFRSNHFIGYVNDKANHRWTAWKARAALTASAPNHSEQVREGWRLVPVEPTPAMVEAAEYEADRQETKWRYDGASFWTAMLVAAPSAVSQKEQGE